MKSLSAAIAALALLVIPLRAQSFSAFGASRSTAVSPPSFSDAELGTLIETLDRLMAGSQPGDAAWQFARRLQTGRLTKPQEVRVLAHLDSLAVSRPGLAELIAGPRKMISKLTVGKPA